MTNSPNPVQKKKAVSPVFRFLRFFSSVRFGIFLLILLGVLSLLGMLIVQQNVEGFAVFYAQLSPAQRTVFKWLGLFDIYHSWYFSLVLAALALNIILASIDRIPSALKTVREPNVTRSVARMESSPNFRDFIFSDGDAASAAAVASKVLRKRGYRDLREASAGTARFVFAQKGAWNRLGAYAVHLSLLVILFGGSLTAWFARSGEMALRPGSESRQIVTTQASADQTRRVTLALPFLVRCRDIRQKLIDSEGSIRPSNTLDWITEITIVDEGKETDLTISLNSPADYRGYRFYHSSQVPLGKARSLTLTATDESGNTQKVTLARNGNGRLKDGTRIRFVDFRAGFDMRTEDPSADTSDYESPAAFLEVTTPGGESENVFVFGGMMGELPMTKRPVAGYTFKVDSYEKVADQHILFVRRDPGQGFVYAGFAMLVVSLLAVFLFSHHRIWFRADGEAAGIRVRISGDTNRPYDDFPSSFARLTERLSDRLRSGEMNGGVSGGDGGDRLV